VSASHTPQQLKRSLIDAGFEVFRTRGNEVVLAERPRENLIMDSGVSLRAGPPLQVRIVLRAEKHDFPHEEDAHLFDRVRKLAAPALEAGYAEVHAATSNVTDPGDKERTLDVFYEIHYAKDADTLDVALQELRFALGLEKRTAA
jgi:hypothetical protein